MPFWSKKKDPSVSELTASYSARSRERLESTDAILNQLDVIFERENPNIAKARQCLAKLQSLAMEQLSEVVPLPDLESQNELAFRMIDIKARTVEDVLTTAGANLETLKAEENEMYREWEALQAASSQRTHDIANAYGVAPPDLTEDGLKKKK